MQDLTMHTITLREANQNFSKYIAAVERGEEFTVTKRGREVARLAPVARPLEPPSADTLPQARQALEARLAKYKLPHTVVKFSRDECYDEQ
jgi:prevent-host-death family protein